MRIAATVLVILAGCAKDEGSSYAWGPLKDVIESSTQVEAFRIMMPKGNENTAYTDWPVSTGPVLVDAPTAKQLATILLDPKSYADTPKACEPRPGVKLRWVSGTRKVEFIFCFECSTLFIFSEEGRGTQREFDPTKKVLAAVMKKIFPQDSEIQALK